MEMLCPLAEAVFGGPEERRCPALEPDGDRFACGLTAHPMAYAMRQTLLHGEEVMSRTAAHLIGVGRGCDAQLEGEPADEMWRAAMLATRNAELTEKCLNVWGFTNRKTGRTKR